MYKFLIITLLTVFFSIPANAATTCFKSGENISGMNKICYYNCLGSTNAINVKSTQLCPLSIKR